MACVSIRIRRDTKANWEKVNPVLKEGEMSFCTDKFMIKFGDGKTNLTIQSTNGDLMIR